MGIPRLIERARREPLIACAYVGLCCFIGGVYWFLHVRGFFLVDHYLTLSAALQTMAFFLLGLKIKACDVQGISPNMLYAYSLAYVARLSTTFTLPGYTPEDGTSEVYLYQSLELVGLVVLLYNIRRVQRMGGQLRSTFMEDVKRENRLVVPSLCVVSLLLGVVTKSSGHRHELGDTVYMFSQWMDTLAMAPQLWLVAREKVVERRTSHFIALAICARVMLGLFWLHTIIAAPHGWGFTVGITSSNALHLVLCADYVYYFIRTIRQPRMVLPGMSG